MVYLLQGNFNSLDTDLSLNFICPFDFIMWPTTMYWDGLSHPAVV